MEPGSEGSVHGAQDSTRKSVSSPDLRLRENFTDNICAESHSRLCRAAVRAPSAELNRTRIPVFVRVCACVHVPPPQKDWIAAQHVGAYRQVLQGKPQAGSTMARMTRFCNVSQESPIEIACTST